MKASPPQAVKKGVRVVQPLWVPSEERIRKSNMTLFMSAVNEKYNKNFSNYFNLYDWSVNNISDFWETVWDFVDIKASARYEKVIDDINKFPGARWFPGAKLNFAENLLRYRDSRTAILFKRETDETVSISYEELYKTVSGLAAALRNESITKGDRVAAYMPNISETVIAMLASTGIGATWASCGSELGMQAVIDRFSQIKPKVLFTIDGYQYKNKPFSILEDVKAVVEAVPSIERVVIVPYISDNPEIRDIPNAVLYNEFIFSNDEELVFEQMDFNDPLYIMFSSGTTGKPKCMIQSVGGILINHLKELVIHGDLTRDDSIIYMTAPSWMMWNWLMSSLAVGCKVVLFDGNPGYPDLGTMWKLVDDEQITFFGTSATYIHLLKNQDYRPKNLFDLSSIRTIGQTGSALSADGYRFVYDAIKSDVLLNSLSGGTDINGCFVIGSPVLPVYAGQLQSPGLGMKIKSYDEKGQHVYDKQGELVCEAPAPSMPIGFINDPEGSRYRGAYFDVYPGVWRHGDYVEFYSNTKGVTFFGRSDAILKPSGVRIGTAEIYNVLEALDEVEDFLAIGQNLENDQRILLFVKLTPGFELTDEVQKKIKNILRTKASPRHVPALIFAVDQIPYTFSGKKVESAVTNIMNGRPVTNRDALSNPASLDYFENLYSNI